MAIMGWSSAAMAKRYQHILDSIRRDVAGQVGGLLRDMETGQDSDGGDDDEGTATAPVPA
jgi:integrase